MTKSVAKESFAQKSNFVAADCEKTVSTSMTIVLPPGAQDVSCEAHWVDTSSVKNVEAHCAVESSGATARGTLSGLAKICSFGQLCSCVSSAHGWLEAKGTYQRSAEGLEAVERTLPQVPSFAPDGYASVALPLTAGETLRGVSVAFARRACPETLDSLDISTPAGQAPTLPASSRTGAFRALYTGRAAVGRGLQCGRIQRGGEPVSATPTAFKRQDVARDRQKSGRAPRLRVDSVCADF